MKSAIFFSLAAWLCLSLGAFAQNTYYVDETGDDSSGDGSQAAPWKTIAYAVEQANANSTINVLTGTYNEGPILIDKSLTVSGIGQTVTVIASSANPLFSIAGNSITIEGLNLQPATSKSGIAILLKKVEGEAVDGINIAQNTISDFNSGIVFETNAEVTNLSISNNFITNNTNGIVVENLVNLDAQSSISNNNLSNNANKSLINNSTVSVINASANWWGEANLGSSVIKPSDIADKVTGIARIDYSPWLTNSNDLETDQEGFQGSFISLGTVKTNVSTNALQEAYDILETNPFVESQIQLHPAVLGTSSAIYNDFIVDTKAFVLKAPSGIPYINKITTNGSKLKVENTVKVNDLDLQEGNIEVLGQITTNKDATFSESANAYITGNIVLEPFSLAADESFNFLGVAISPSEGADPLNQLTIRRTTGEPVTLNDNKSISVKWDISVNNGEFSPRDLTFTWNTLYDNSLDFEVANAVVWKREDESSSWEAVTQDLATVDNNIRSISVANVTSFSQWTVSNETNPLPVELTRFSAFLSEPHVELQWETASEINSNFFAIERSEDGKTFAQIGKLKAAGKSDTPLQYNYIDEQAANRLSGSVFYRLRTVDFDGSFEYSDITVVNINGDDLPMITAYAHASQSHLKLFTRAIEAGDYQLWISDLSGRKVYEQNVQLDAKEVYEINVGQLPQSVYLIRCVGKELALSSKFRVEAGN
ncbi:DUF1565 domain-containing protein [Porifericola rhodea]|uniref:DUF1565 domain-containing protein n=1 Tax=Porifericola rhodea TaxID=930972 RepID=UPI0026661A48|nr:DUF1565 domain-containing protein [Porifericola rhodea]WKN32888.1 DUF1565 domain-containing protein [Porifericola rhodea]